MNRLNWKSVVFQGLAFLLGIYFLLRAWLLPFTVDEVSTVISMVPRNVPDIILYTTDPVPNNHVLNTLSIKFLTALFGDYYVINRVPVLLGGMLYLWAALALTRRGTHFWLRLFTFVMLLSNPFVLEFFSLARGYGLALGLFLMAVWRALAWLESGRAAVLLQAVVCGALAVEANFTLLNFYAPFALLLLLAGRQKSAAGFFKRTWPVFGVSAVLAALCYLPIVRMRATNQFVFWGTDGFFKSTVLELMKSSTAGDPALGKSAALYLSLAAVLFSLGAWLAAAIRIRRVHWKIDADAFISALFGGTVCFNFLQHFLFKTPFLNPRTALFFYPLFALQTVVVANWLWARWSKKALIYILPLLFVAVFTFARGVNLNHSHEWWFDRGTFRVLEYLKTLQQTERVSVPYSLDTDWQMFNSMGYHISNQKKYETVARLPDWHGLREYPRNTEFYYALGGDQARPLLDEYDIVYRVPDASMLLLRRKAKQ